jgi:hypothetical protein
MGGNFDGDPAIGARRRRGKVADIPRQIPFVNSF